MKSKKIKVGMNSTLIVLISAVIDKHFVDRICDKTAISRKYDMSTKILFCRHNSVKIKINIGSLYFAEEVNELLASFDGKNKCREFVFSDSSK